MIKTVTRLVCLIMILSISCTMTACSISSNYIQNLTQLKIIDADNLRENEYLTYRECFDYIIRAVGAKRIIDRFAETPIPISDEEKMNSFIALAKPASAEERDFAQNSKAENIGLLDGFPEEVDMSRVATRAELAVIISRLMGYSYIGSFQFKDFDYSSWYGDDFARTAFCYIIMGDNGYIRPDDPITREETRAMLSNAFVLEDYNGFAGKPKDLVSFSEIFSALDEMIDVYYALPRAYDNEQTIINGNVFIMSPGTVLKNTVINGNLYIAPRVGNEHAQGDDRCLALDNVTVNGKLVLPYFYGEKIYLMDCDIKTVIWLRDNDSSKLFITYRNGEPILDSGKSITLNDDFSLTWELPDNTLGIDSEQVSAYDEDGEEIGGYGTVRIQQEVDTRELLGFAVKAYPKKLSKVAIEYTDREPLTIGLNNIIVREAGSALRPATLVETEDFETILTLAEGEFVTGKWYCITRREQDPYEPEESKAILTVKKIYMATQSGKSCLFDNFFGYMGGGPREGISIQAITLSGDPKTGFEIILTPESSETFEEVVKR